MKTTDNNSQSKPARTMCPWEIKLIKKRSRYFWKFFNDFGFEPNAADSLEETALMATATPQTNFTKAAASILLRNGWDINVTDVGGSSALNNALHCCNWPLADYILQRYEPTEANLIRSLYMTFQVYSRDIQGLCDKNILTIIEKLGGVTPEKHPDALLFAYGGRAVPYIPALLAAGFTTYKDLEEKYFFDDYDGREHLFDTFMKGKEHFHFKNCDSYPLYIRDGALRARPELYRKTWPPLPRKKKKFHYRATLRTLNFVAKWTSRLCP